MCRGSINTFVGSTSGFCVLGSNFIAGFEGRVFLLVVKGCISAVLEAQI